MMSAPATAARESVSKTIRKESKKLKREMEKQRKKELRKLHTSSEMAEVVDGRLTHGANEEESADAQEYKAPKMTRAERKELNEEAGRFFRRLSSQWPPVCDPPGFTPGEWRDREWAEEWSDVYEGGHGSRGAGIGDLEDDAGWPDPEDEEGGEEVYDVYGRPVSL